MSDFFTLLTTVGAAKLANATALGTTVEISEMAVGDGGGEAVVPNQSQTALVNEIRRKPLNSITIDPDNPNWIVCEQVLPPDEGGWTIREVGLFDADGNLIAVGNFPETYKPLLSEGSGRTQTIRIVLEVSSADSVELKIDPSVVLATRDYVDRQDENYLEQAKAYADLKDSDLKAYVDAQDKAGQTAAKSDATKKANQALENAKNDSSEKVQAHLDADDPHPQYITGDELDKALDNYADENPALQAGEVILVSGVNAPSGTIKANGASLSRTTYSDLWAYALASGNLVDETDKDSGNYGTGDGETTFTIPDYRGEFIRLWDDGRGVDIDRAIGSFQGDAIRNIEGDFGGVEPKDGTSTGLFSDAKRYKEYTVSVGNTHEWAVLNMDVSRVVPTANENRPRNIALLGCIKY